MSDKRQNLFTRAKIRVDEVFDRHSAESLIRTGELEKPAYEDRKGRADRLRSHSIAVAREYMSFDQRV
jgi:hypothetical protein